MQYDPVIIIPGIGQSALYMADEKGGHVKNVWPFELDEKKLISEFKSSLMAMLLFKKDAGFSDKVAKVVSDITEPLSVNGDGTKKHNIQPVTYEKSLAECSENEKRFIYKMVPLEELGEKIGEENLFFFAYDPFCDVYDTADSLHRFIAMVKEKTGSEKVGLISVSIGGVVLKAYCQKFASEKEIGKVLNIVSALDGTSVVADLFENKLCIGDPAALLSSMGGKAASLASSVKMLPADIVNNAITKAFNTAVNDLLYNCTTMWGAIPNRRFDAIYQARLADGGNAVLAEKVKSLHDYAVDFTKNMAAIPFYMICGYGKKLLPVIESADTSSDGIIDVSSASLGGCADSIGAPVDTAGCAFPDRTWFFKEQSHNGVAYNDIALSLAVKIMTGEIDSVNSETAYPQFNGSRNIKALKYTLIPNAKKAMETADEPVKSQLLACIEEYNAMLANTVIEDGCQAKALEEKLSQILDSVKE